MAGADDGAEIVEFGVAATTGAFGVVGGGEGKGGWVSDVSVVVVGCPIVVVVWVG